MDKNREELLETAVHRLMGVMRHVRHPGPPPDQVLSPPQIHLLFTISASPEGLSAKELAERSSITPGAVTQFVNALVDKGLVAREGDPNDRRVVMLKATVLAKKQREKFRKEQATLMAKIFEGLSNDELKQLIALFTKMADYYEKKENTDAKTP
jgi:DNA-binding MarR family transcriptional regulator